MNDDERTPTPHADLARDLGRLYRPRFEVPSEVDDQVLHAARANRLASGWRRWRIRVAAAAAALLVGMTIWVGLLDQNTEPPPALAGDVDGSGRVDIVDAFLLAKRVERASASDLRFDLNGDGAVDRGAVDHVALAAVRLR